MLGITDHRPVRASARALSVERVLAIVFGVLAGVVAIEMQSLELRWIVIPVVGLAAGIFVFVMPNKESLLSAALVLSLQANLNLRLLYGHAGSTGLSIPITVVIALGLVALYWWRGEFRTRRQWQWLGIMALPIVAYLVTTATSVLFTVERFVGVTQILFDLELYLIYALTLNSIRSRADIHRIVGLLFIALAVQSVIYYIQSALGITFMLSGHVVQQGEIPRPGGTISTVPAEFASFVIPILMIALAQLLANTARMHRGLLVMLIALATGAIALTYTRAAWAAYLLGTGWIVLVGYRRRLLHPRTMMFVCVAAIVGAIAMAPLVAKRLEGSPLGDSWSERKGLMTMAIRIIRAEPVLGVGAGAYGHVYKRYLTADDDDRWLWLVHNKYLLRTAETGLIGGFALIALFGTALRLALRLTRSRDRSIATLGLGIGAGLIAMCWEMYWDTFRGFTYNALLWLLFGLMAAAWMLERRARHEEDGLIGDGRDEVDGLDGLADDRQALPAP